MYSFSLGFVIFLISSFEMQMKATSYTYVEELGSDFHFSIQ